METILVMAFALYILLSGLVIFLVGRAKGIKGYERGYMDALEDAQRRQLEAPSRPSEPYGCPHVWGPWSKARWYVRPGGSPVSGWGRMQRRFCELCNEEEERVVG